MSIEERFQTAVNVIKGLPKNGPFQPSYDMMLRFYSFFKQATEGPCLASKSRRPAFWDMVGKVKYDAWKRLGDMPREKAMEAYVDELRQIVETMSYTQNVAEFYNSLNQFDMKVEDIELIAPDVIRSKSEQNSPQHKTNNEDAESIPNGGDHNINTVDSSDDDDEFIDTVDEEIASIAVERPREKNYAHLNGGIHKKTPMTEVTNKLNIDIDSSLTTHLVQITDKMKLDLQQVNNRISVLEQKITRKRKYPKWWPFQDISPSFFAFTFFWPIVVALAFRTLQRKQLLNRGGGIGKRS